MSSAVSGTFANTGNTLIDGLAWGSRWVSVGPTTVIDVGYSPAGDNVGEPTQAELDAMMRTLEYFERYINVDFNFVGADPTASADIRFVISTERGTGLLGEASPPGESFDANRANPGGSDVFIYRDSYAKKSVGLLPGSFDFITFIHEFGHAMGLAHPHDDGGTPTDPSLIFPGADPDRPFSRMGDFKLNQGVYTMMSYIDGWHTTSAKTNLGFEATPMALDIMTLQAMYGANTTFASSDDAYALPSLKGDGVAFTCIWDTGGNDTISNNSAKACTIDLRDATGLVEEGGGGFVSNVKGIRGGFTIANGADIENAIGGTGADKLIGNELNNRLTGNAGKDTMTGGDGLDAFVFLALTDTKATTSSADIITDFDNTYDWLDVSAIDANALLDGVQDFDYMAGATAFTDPGQIRSAVVKGNTVLYFNTDLDKAAEGVIVLKGIVEVTDDSFLF
jgi:serralysin